MSDRVSLSVDEDGIGRLALVRADARNAIDPAMVKALASAVEQAADEPDLRALLLTHEGPVFSVGGDLRYLAPRVDTLPKELEAMIAAFHRALAGIAQLPVPVVCAASGAVAGGALGLLWCADVTIVAVDAKLAAGFLELGLSGDGGSSWWLPRLVGFTRARELLLTGRVLTGTEAADWGLVTRAVPAEHVDSDALEAARGLAALAREAYAETRALLASSFERGLAGGLQAELEAMIRTAGTAEAQRRIAAWR